MFATLVERLDEHLGVMYREFLKNSSNKLWLRWQDLGGPSGSVANWQEQRIKPIEVPYDSDGCEETPITVSTPHGTTTAIYRRGNLDKGKVEDPAPGFPYPLKIYYQGNVPTQGIDVVVKKRVIKTGQLEGIWPEYIRHNDLNAFVGELVLDGNFRTVNNKTALDPHNDFWETLDEILVEEKNDFEPERTANLKGESEIKGKLTTILLGTATASTVTRDHSIWSGSGVKIDLYHSLPSGEINIYEVKKGTATPIDAYQLLMYWDGVVKDELKSPALARLVAKDFHDSVKNIINDINKRKDGLGNNYKLEPKTISEIGI
jgi:hypothetical protein